MLEEHIHPTGFFRMCNSCSSGQLVSLCLQIYLFTSHLETKMWEIPKRSKRAQLFLQLPCLHCCSFNGLLPSPNFFLATLTLLPVSIKMYIESGILGTSHYLEDK